MVRRWWLVSAGIVVLVTLGVVVWRLRADSRTGAGNGVGATEAVMTRRASGNARGDAVVAEVRSPTVEPFVLVRDAEGEAPIAAGFAIGIPATAGETIATTSSKRLVRCDSLGRLSLRDLGPTGPWLVQADGYVPCVLESARAGAIVGLGKAARVEVRAMQEDGNPAEGVVLALRPASVRSQSLLPVLGAAVGVGDPRSEAPTWIARTDGMGVAAMDVPVGHYRMRSVDRFSYADDSRANGRVSFSAPSTFMVQMRELYAVCLAPPTGRSIVTYSLTMPLRRDIGVPVQLGKAGGEAYLLKQFPDAIVRVARPLADATTENDRMVRCTAVLDGHVAATAAWPLRPIRSIEDCVYLAVDEKVLIHAVTIRILSAQHELSGDVILGGRGGGYRGRLGEPILVPEGTYKVTLTSHWVADRLEEAKAKIVVARSDPFQVERIIPLKGVTIRTVAVSMEWQGDAFRGYLGVSFQNSERRSGAIVNWTPARGPIELAFPLGTASFKTSSPFYEEESGSFEVVAGAGAQPVKIKLRRKATAAK